MRIVMIGTGYVGLVSGACFSELGYHVTCIDKDRKKINVLNSGEVPFYEPGLKNIIEASRKDGRLNFTTETSEAISDADIIFLAVGTPCSKEDNRADLTYVFQAAREIVQKLSGYTVIVMKSTVPVGTGKQIENLMREIRPDAEFDIVSNPEFLREGSAVSDFKNPDRLIIGTRNPKARNVMERLYQPFGPAGVLIHHTSVETSELIKYAANAFLATKIAFINEVADLCEAVDADISDVAKGMGLDSRIGSKFLEPGPGYGGSCFPKDTLAMVHTAQDYGVNLSIVQSTIDANDKRKINMASRVIESCGGDVKGKTIAILGVAFKANTDDVRDSPSLDVISELQKKGAKVQAFDPEGMQQGQQNLENVVWCMDMYQAIKGSSAIVIMTEWNVFRSLDFIKARTLVLSPVLIDFRNIFVAEDVLSNGFAYQCVGKPLVRPQNINLKQVI